MSNKIPSLEWTQRCDRERIVDAAYHLAKAIDSATPGGLVLARKALAEAGKDYAYVPRRRRIYRQLARALKSLEEA